LSTEAWAVAASGQIRHGELGGEVGGGGDDDECCGPVSFHGPRAGGARHHLSVLVLHLERLLLLLLLHRLPL
jgi:hypothetical protein